MRWRFPGSFGAAKCPQLPEPVSFCARASVSDCNRGGVCAPAARLWRAIGLQWLAMRSEKLWDVYTARAGDRVYHGICETGMLKEREKRGWD